MIAQFLCLLLYTTTILPTESLSYNVDIKLIYQGGSTEDFFLVIKGNNGQTDKHLLNGMTTTTLTGSNIYSFQIDDIDVGTITHSYLVTYGSDDLGVKSVTINSNSVSETTADYVGYNGNYPYGCQVLTVDFGGSSMSTADQEPCTTIQPPTAAPTTAQPSMNPIPGTLSPTEAPSAPATIVYNVDITLLLQGGSVEDFFLIIDGDNGQTDKHLLDGMTTGGDTYSFQFSDVNIGTINYAYLVTFGSDDLVVTDVVINSIYSVSETLGDAVAYNGGTAGVCDVLTIDFGGNTMGTSNQEPCTIMAPPTSAPTTAKPTMNPTAATLSPTAAPSNPGEIRYDVDITLLYQGGSKDDFFLIIKGDNGETAKHLINGMTDTTFNGPNIYSFNLIDTDVGTITYACIVGYGSDDLVIKDIDINWIYSVSELTGDNIGYNDANPFGCDVLTADFNAGTMETTIQEPCIRIPPLEVLENSMNSTYKIYSIEIEVFTQGGSNDEIFAGIEGLDGDLTEFVSIGQLKDAGNTGKTYNMALNLTNVGLGAKLYLLNYGKDSLLVEGCRINGASTSESSWDILEYDGKDPRGCHTLICDVLNNEMNKKDSYPCLNYEIPPITNQTRTYKVIIEVQEQGGSQDPLYIMVQGLSGRMTDPFYAKMPNGGQKYSFDIITRDIGDPKAVYLVKLASDGSDALLVEGCQIDTYIAEELEGDLLEYTGDDLRGCGYVKCNLLADEVIKGEQDICDLIPVILQIGNGTNSQYFVSIDTTNIPFSVPGGTKDEIWLRIINTDNEKSEYVSLGSDIMTDDGESYAFRPTVRNLGNDISKLEFIQFGDDDLCIDYCQINGQFVDIGLFASECNENDIKDNDGCAIMTCDYELNQITSMIESPCKHDVYGWINKTYRVYTVIIDVCPDGGEMIDTWSMDPFWIYLESEEYGISDSFKINGIGKDDENIFKINTTNIGSPDKLYLIHYNNDDICILDITVDGFEVTTFPWIASEYDCEYSDDGCNVITVDFELNEMNIESKANCPYIPNDFDAENDKCIDEKIQEKLDQFLGLTKTVGIILLIVIIVIIISCFICCIWIGYSLQKGGIYAAKQQTQTQTHSQNAIEMDTR